MGMCRLSYLTLTMSRTVVVMSRRWWWVLLGWRQRYALIDDNRIDVYLQVVLAFVLPLLPPCSRVHDFERMLLVGKFVVPKDTLLNIHLL